MALATTVNVTDAGFVTKTAAGGAALTGPLTGTSATFSLGMESAGVNCLGGMTVLNGFGANGTAAQTKVTVNAASIDLATVVALCNQLRAALVANGIAV